VQNVIHNISAWLLFAFLFLVSVPYLSITSVPLVLFLLACLVDREKVAAIFLEFRIEIGVLITALLIGIVFSYLPGKSVKGVYDFLRGAVLFFPVFILVRYHPKRLSKALPWMVVVASVYICCAMILSAKGVLYDQGLMRRGFSPLLGHYNNYGTMSAVVCLAGLAGLTYLSWSHKEKIALGFAVFGGLLLTVLSGSRGSTVALAVCLVALFYLRFSRRRWLIVSAGTIVSLLISFFLYSAHSGGFLSSWQRKGGDFTSKRLAIYEKTIIDTWYQEPLTGFGPNTYKYLDFGQALKKKLFLPHSVFLESFYSLGIVGSVLLLAALILFVVKSKRSTGNFFGAFGLALLGFYLLRGVVDYKLFSVPYTGAMAAALALMLGVDEKLPRKKMRSVGDMMSKKKAVFLDRDGTINVEKNYLYKPEDLELFDGAAEAIRSLKSSGYLVIVVTNQSGVARGYFTVDDVNVLHEHLQKELAKAGAEVDAFYLCPHHPTEGQGDYLRECDCRKGAPGMLLEAAEEFNVDLKRSYMVGDKLADIDAGQRAGCKSLLVLTGYGEETAADPGISEIKKCRDINSAAEYILSEENGSRTCD
jgi:D-glycero-D-manno-heptose 1,7-bisphosphate phosphatase